MAAAFNLTAQINLQGPSNLKPVVANIKKELSGIKATVDLEVKASSARNIAAINSKLKELTKFATNANVSIKDLNSSLGSLTTSLNKAASAGSTTSAGIESTNTSLKTTKKALSEATTEIEEFGKQSGLAIRRFAAFSTVTTVVYSLINAFSSAFKEFVNFNKEIVRLSQVTGQSVAELSSVTDEITRLSTGLGVASSDLLIVSTTLAQAGLSAEDTRIALEALAKSSLAPSFDNLTDTTEGAIAVLRQFGLQASELEGALGSINAVSAAFAVEASDLITAIQRTGGVFASSSKGVTEGKDALNEFLAVFTSVRQTTRESAETIATGLRTIFTRIQRRETIDALKQYGVELTDLEGKFVGPFEAVKRLSDGLNRLDPRSLDFSGITEELGGFRQIGKVIPLIQQFAVSQEALRVAQRGQDSLAQDAAVAQESLANKFIKTREAFVALVRDIGDSTTFKALTDVTFALANGLIALGKALEPLLPLLVTFGALKIGSGLTQFVSGFGRGFGGRGGGGGAPGQPPTSPTNPTSPSGSTKNDVLLSNNTTALSSLVSPINNLLQSINTVNSTLNQTNTLLKSRPIGSGAPKAFARGGLVPGRGSRDTVPAMLTPGEFVIRKKAVQALGLGRLTQMNRYAGGGRVTSKFGAVGLVPMDDIEDAIGRVIIGTGASGEVSIASVLKRLAGGKVIFGGRNQGGVNKADWQNAIRTAIGGQPSITTTVTGRTFKLASLEAQLGDDVDRLMSQLVVQTAQALGASVGAGVSGSVNSGILQSIGTRSTIGSIFEGALSLLGAPFDTLSKEQDAFDFPAGLGSQLSQYFGFESGMPVEAKKFLTPDLMKDIANRKATNYIAQQVYNSPEWQALLKRRKFASGGSIPKISHRDTVPALLTPGEFVINKKAAQRIGYGNLKRLNYADKVRGYNKGGIVGTQRLNSGGTVQRFAVGGQVGAADVAAIASVIGSLLIPQVEKLANSFSDADGKISEFGAGLTGALKELTSLTASAGIGLSVVGAGTRDKAIGIGGAAVGGFISGAISESSAVSLKDALDSNSKSLEGFNKLIQQFQETTDPREQERVSADVQKSFAELVKTFDKNARTIDQSDKYQKLGEAITSGTTTFLTIQTTGLALSGALTQSTVAAQANAIAQTEAAAAAQANAIAQRNAATSAGVSSASAVATGSAATGLAFFGTKLLAAAGWIGLAVGAIQTVVSIISIFSNNSKKASEQIVKLAEASAKATKANTDFSLNNERYTKILLERFKELRSQQASGAISDSDLRRSLGGIIGSGISGREVTIQLPNGEKLVASLNEMSASLRTFVASQARNIDNGGLVLDTNQDISQSLDELRKTFPDRVTKLESKLSDILLRYLQEQYILMRQREQPGLNAPEIIQEFENQLNGGAVSVQNLADKVAQSTGAIEAQSYAANIAAQTSLQLSQNFIRLADLSSVFQSRLAALVSTIETNNKTLQNRISTLIDDQPRVTGGSDVLRQNAQILNNLKGFDADQISNAVSSSLRLLDLELLNIDPSQNRQSVDVINALGSLSADISQNILVIKTLEDNLSILSKNITSLDNTKQFDLFTRGLKDALADNTGVGSQRASEIAQATTDVLRKSLQDGKALTANELIAQVKELDNVVGAGAEGLKILSIASEETAKVLDIVNENANKYSRTILQGIQLENKRIQAQFENFSELGKILGQQIKQSDIGKIFDQQIKNLTGGLTNVSDIARAQENAIKALDGTEGQPGIRARREASPLDASLIREENKQVTILQNTNAALELIINSGTNLKASFDKLAEKEKKLFSGPRNVLLEFLKDPKQFRETQRVFQQELPRVLSGTATPQELARVLEIVPKLLRELGREQEAINIERRIGDAAIGKATIAAFTEAVNKSDFTGAVQSLFVGGRATVLDSLKSLFLAPETVEVNKNISEIDAAYKVLSSKIDQAGKILGEEGITGTLNKFNTELPDIIARRISVENIFINRLEKMLTDEQKQNSVQRADTASRANMGTVALGLTDVANNLEKITNGFSIRQEGVYDPGTGRVISITTEGSTPLPVNIENLESLRSINQTTSPAEAIALVRSQVGAIGSLLNKDLLTTQTLSPEARQKLEEQQKKLIQALDELSAIERSRATQLLIPNITRPPIVPRIPSTEQRRSGTQGEASTLDTSQLKNTFNNFISSLSTTLTTQSETFGTNLILRLNGVFSNFDKTVSTFKSSSEVLVAKLNDFNARGGIKGPNIPQEVSVKVAFDDDLTVVAQNNTNLITDISSAVADAVKNQLNKLTIFG